MDAERPIPSLSLALQIMRKNIRNYQHVGTLRFTFRKYCKGQELPVNDAASVNKSYSRLTPASGLQVNYAP